MDGGAAAEPGRRGRLERRRLDPRIYLLALGTFAIGTDVFVIAGLLPMIARDLSVSVEAAGQMVTAYALTYALGSPILAALTARWRRERTIVFALTGFALADTVCALAPNFAILVAARIVAGCCAALYAPTAYTIAAALAPPARRGAALATVALGMTSATVFGVPLGAWIGHRVGWHITFLLGVALAASAAAALKVGRVPPGATTTPPPLRARFAPLARPGVLLSLLANLFWSAGSYTVYTYSAVLFGAPLGLDSIALLLLCYGLGGLTGSQSGGRIADRFGTTAPILVCVSLNILNLAALHFTGDTVIGAGAALFGMGFCAWAIFPAQQSQLLAAEPEHGAIVLSLIGSTIYLGSAAGAALGGALLAHFSPSTLPGTASLVACVGLVLFLFGLGARRRSRA
jgi:MFS transporter, DHA1 family, inner membrane transport protein